MKNRRDKDCIDEMSYETVDETSEGQSGTDREEKKKPNYGILSLLMLISAIAIPFIFGAENENASLISFFLIIGSIVSARQTLKNRRKGQKAARITILIVAVPLIILTIVIIVIMIRMFIWMWDHPDYEFEPHDEALFFSFARQLKSIL